ncbi:hypothetical protein X559_1882 [Paenilisteria newyorkensis]|nr:hypothetical protein X559_1882 [Listeria newyorkensis]
MLDFHQMEPFFEEAGLNMLHFYHKRQSLLVEDIQHWSVGR